MRHRTRRSLVIAILLVPHLFLVACREHADNTTNDPDSVITARSTDFHSADDTVIINQGRALFAANCGSCHAILKTDNYLAGVVERVGVNYLKLYVTKQDSLIKAKDKYALELKKAFGNLGNSHNFNFSDQQLNAIIAYLKKYSS